MATDEKDSNLGSIRKRSFPASRARGEHREKKRKDIEMKRHQNIVITGSLMVAGAMASNVALAGDCTGSKKKASIFQTAVEAGSFKTLAQALDAAGLVDTLQSQGPFTVFAPTDEAFAKLPAGTLDKLIQNPGQLRAVLLYHVVPGKVTADQVSKRSSAETALGQELTISTAYGVMINDAKVVTPDVMASNGVIHVIDSVLIPDNDIVETARAAGSFNTLLTALEAAGLTDALRGDGPFTVFAPTDAAFAKLPDGTVEALLEDKNKLTAILTYHVVPGRVLASDVMKLDAAQTLNGQSLDIKTSSGVTVDNAHVVKTDVMATHGVIHVIDTVMIPE